MTARTQGSDTISPLQAFVFAVALTVALVAVLVPPLPGEISLEVGDIAPRTFEINGTIIAEEGDEISFTDLAAIRDGGLAANHITFTGTLAAVIFAALAFFFSGLAGIFIVRRAQRVNHYVAAGMTVGLVTFAVLFAFWLLAPNRGGMGLVWML